MNLNQQKHNIAAPSCDVDFLGGNPLCMLKGQDYMHINHSHETKRGEMGMNLRITSW